MNFLYRHPELPGRVWRLPARDLEEAQSRFESVWMAWVHSGELESVDGGYYDGEVVPDSFDARKGLDPVVPCANSLGGHMWQPDARPERLEFAEQYERFNRKPEVCLLCQELRWA